MPEVTDKEPPFNGNPNPLPNLANVDPPYMARLSLPEFIIGLPMWLFSTYSIPNTQTIPHQPSSSSQPHQPYIDPLPSSPNMSSSPSSSSLGKSLDASN